MLFSLTYEYHVNIFPLKVSWSNKRCGMRTRLIRSGMAAFLIAGVMALCGCKDFNDKLMKAVPDFTVDVVEGVAPLTVQFTDFSSGSITAWQWDFDNDGNVDSTGQNPVHTYSTAGIYAVALTVSGPAGSASVTRAACVSVYDTLQIGAVSPTDAIPGQAYGPLQMQATGGKQPVAWSLGTGSDPLPAGLALSALTGEISGTPQAGTEGLYNLILRVTDSLGTAQSDTAGFTLTVRPSILPVVDFTATPTAGSTPLTVSFLDMSTGDITAWEWDFENDGTPDSTDRNSLWTYTDPGWYTVKLTVSGPGGSDSLTKRKYIQVYSGVWFVDASGGSDSNGGTSWTDAFATIQTGINAATDLEMILVADGTYTGVDNRNLNFGGRKIYLKSANGPDGCIINCQSQGRGFVFNSGETSDSVIEGFTLRRANAVGSGGGGIICQSSSPTIINCVLDSNTADIGSGILCIAGADATLLSCTVKNNYSVQYGAGVGCVQSSPVILNCTIKYNQSEKFGGGIACADNSNSVITGCTINGNFAYQFGGGVVLSLNSNATMTGCAITGNWSLGGGGAGGTGAGLYCNESSPAITGCTIDNNIGIDCIGGGIAIFDSSPAFSNCSVSGNRVSFDSGAGGFGAGIYCSGSLSGATFYNCTVSENQASEFGSGVVCTDYASATFENCVVTGNRAGDNGGGVLCTQNADTTFISTSITYNQSDGNGGGIYCDNSIFNAINCVFTGNSANSGHGGGIYFENSTATVTGSTFEANSASALGGALHCEDCSPVITGCTISGNLANTGAGICCRTDASPEIYNSLIVRNVAVSDGGGLCSFSTCGPVVANCTIAGNLALSNRGGGVFCFDPNPVFNNTVIWGNAASNGNQIHGENAGTTVTLNFCCIPDIMTDPGRFSGAAAVDFSNNCIETDPLFVDAARSNYRLQSTPAPSPCIDAGDNALLPPGITEDVEGNPRITNGTVDIGAYEKP
jgi:predicted outer membrane repeat protein